MSDVVILDGNDIEEQNINGRIGESKFDMLSWSVFPVMTLVLWAAFALRAFRIDGQSYWYDEGVSVVMAQRDLLTIAVNAAADIHPPLYYYLLHFWSALVGTDEFTLRWLSLTFGVLLVAVAFKLGQRLFDSRVGFATALFAAVAPFPIYYSQEARMYMQVAFLGALSTYLFLNVERDLLDRDDGLRINKTFVTYLIVSIALLYSHYFAFTILAFHNSWMVLRLAAARQPFGDRLKRLAWWVGIQLSIVVAFLPWMVMSFAQVGGWPSISKPFGLDTLLYRVFLVFTFGLSWTAAATPNRESAFLALAVCSLLAPLLWKKVSAQQKNGRLSLLFSILYFLIPVLIMYILSIRRPMYNPKFLLLATPGYYLLLGIGSVSIGRLFSSLMRLIPSFPSIVRHIFETTAVLVLLIGAVFFMSQSTLAYYFDPKYARDDYRGLAHLVEAQAEDGDAIILNAPGQIEIFGHYFKGKQAIYPLPEQRPMDKQKTDAALKTIATQHKRIWLVLWAQTESDPDGFVEHWLDENSFKASNSWFGGVRLVQYVVGGNDAAWQSMTKSTFGDSILLNSIRIGSSTVQPGGVLDVTLDWQALKAVKERYTVFLHIIDANENLWGQRDSEPGGGSKLTTIWNVGETIEDRHGIPVLPGTPPGRYQVELGLYQRDNGQRLQIAAEDGRPIGDRLLFGQVEILKSSSPFKPETLAVQNKTTLSFTGNLRLLGFDFHILGQSVTSRDFHAGDMALATLYWQAESAIPREYVAQLEIVGKDGKIEVQHLAPPGGETYPTNQWNGGGLVRDQRKLSLANLDQGEYSLRMRVADRQTKAAVTPDGDKAALDGATDLLKFQIR